MSRRTRALSTLLLAALGSHPAQISGARAPASDTVQASDAAVAAERLRPLSVSALPLRRGYRATMPVFIDRFGRVAWYAVEVVRDTSLVRANGRLAPIWEVLATGDSAVPSARFWVSQHQRFVDQVLVWEPGVSIWYARE